MSSITSTVRSAHAPAQVGIGVVASLAAVGGLLLLTDAPRLAEAARRGFADPAAIALAAVAYAAAFWLRALAWRRLTPASGPATGTLFSILHAAFVVNHALPVKAGEVLRPVLAQRAGMPVAVAVTSTVAARAVDAVALLAVAVTAALVTATTSAFQWPSVPSISWSLAPLIASAALDTALLAALGVATFAWIRTRSLRLTRRLVEAVSVLHPARLAECAALSVVSWPLEAAVTLAGAQLLGLDLPVGLAVAATTVAVGVQVAQVTPGGLGVYEAGMASVLVVGGMPLPEAVSLALVTHGLKFAYGFSLGAAFALPALVLLVRSVAGAERRAGMLEIVAARAWNVLNEGKPFTPVFTLGVVMLLTIPRLGQSGAAGAHALALVASMPLALVWWRFDFPLRLRVVLWLGLGAWLAVFGVTSVTAVAWTMGLYFLFTVVLWGTVYYHLRIGTPWTNFTRFFRLVIENPDPTSGNALEQLPKVVLLAWTFEHVVSAGSPGAAFEVAAFALAFAVVAALAHQWWFTWVPALPQRRLTEAAPGARVARRVIVIAIDGCRADRLAEARTPRLDRLRAEGTTFTNVSTVYPARTVTTFASMLTGAPPEVHGMRSNFVPRLGVRCESVFDVLREARMHGAMVGIAHLIDAFGERDVRTVSAVMANDEIDEALTARARQVLHDEDPELLVLQLLSVDQAGHSRGSYRSEYLERIEATDALIGRFLAWCEQEGYLDGATVLVTSDHGQGIGIGGHGHMSPPEIVVPCIWWGAGVPAGESHEELRFLPEVASSVCGLLGVRAPSAAVGRPLVPAAPEPLVAPTVFVLPARNEAGNIEGVLEGIRQLELPAVEVVVVDDGSTDATAEIARRAGVRVVQHTASRGLGAALRTGLAAARDLRPAAVVYLDADGEYDPADAPALLAPIARGDADYVLGSRMQGGASGMRTPRRVANRGFSLALSLLSGRWITDGQTGMRAFSPRALQVAEIIHDYNYAQVLTLDLLHKGMRMVQVPISYCPRRLGDSFVSGEYLWRVPLAMAREVLRG